MAANPRSRPKAHAPPPGTWRTGAKVRRAHHTRGCGRPRSARKPCTSAAERGSAAIAEKVREHRVDVGDRDSRLAEPAVEESRGAQRADHRRVQWRVVVERHGVQRDPHEGRLDHRRVPERGVELAGVERREPGPEREVGRGRLLGLQRHDAPDALGHGQRDALEQQLPGEQRAVEVAGGECHPVILAPTPDSRPGPGCGACHRAPRGADWSRAGREAGGRRRTVLPRGACRAGAGRAGPARLGGARGGRRPGPGQGVPAAARGLQSTPVRRRRSGTPSSHGPAARCAGWCSSARPTGSRSTASRCPGAHAFATPLGEVGSSSPSPPCSRRSRRSWCAPSCTPWSTRSRCTCPSCRSLSATSRCCRSPWGAPPRTMSQRCWTRCGAGRRPSSW